MSVMQKSSMVCLDASFVLRLILGGPGAKKAEHLWTSWSKEGIQPAAPALIFYEVANAVYRLSFNGVVTFDEAEEALDITHDLRIASYTDAFIHKRAPALARNAGLKAVYDAHYLALAENLGTELWTADRRLANAVRDEYPWVKCLDDVEVETVE